MGETARPSTLLRRDVAEVCRETGDDPAAVAADLDNAVHEFHAHFKPLIEKKVNEYLKDLREQNAKRTGSQEPFEPDEQHMQQLWTEGHRYWILGEVVRFYAKARATTDGGLMSSGTYMLAKKATYTYLDKSNKGTTYYEVPDHESLDW